MSERELNIQLRHADIHDVPFIFNAWLKSFRSAPSVTTIHNNIYYAEHHKVLEKILRSFNVLIAADKHDPKHIYGFMVAGTVEEIKTVHYLYVKHTFRRLGIAKALLSHFQIPSDEPFFYTHETPVGRIMGKKYHGVYHPYLAFQEPKKQLEPSNE
jgi:ribosomal protein S18 acetylase RimI-like enzyme